MKDFTGAWRRARRRVPRPRQRLGLSGGRLCPRSGSRARASRSSAGAGPSGGRRRHTAVQAEVDVGRDRLSPRRLRDPGARVTTRSCGPLIAWEVPCVHVPHAVPLNRNGTAPHLTHRMRTDQDRARRLASPGIPPADRTSEPNRCDEASLRAAPRVTLLPTRARLAKPADRPIRPPTLLTALMALDRTGTASRQ